MLLFDYKKKTQKQNLKKKKYFILFIIYLWYDKLFVPSGSW